MPRNIEKLREYKRRWQAQWRLKNLDKVRTWNRSYSASHAEQIRARVAKWQAENPERKRTNARKYQRKRYAEDPVKAAAYARGWYAKWSKENPELAKELRRQNYAARRAEVLAAYGGKCACCGETQPEFLTIDHINNDGAKHRKEIGVGGTSLYSWLRKNQFPKEGFQILCWNCNCAKRLSGRCPHYEERARAGEGSIVRSV